MLTRFVGEKKNIRGLRHTYTYMYMCICIYKLFQLISQISYNSYINTAQ